MNCRGSHSFHFDNHLCGRRRSLLGLCSPAIIRVFCPNRHFFGSILSVDDIVSSETGRDQSMYQTLDLVGRVIKGSHNRILLVEEECLNVLALGNRTNGNKYYLVLETILYCITENRNDQLIHKIKSAEWKV